MATRLPGACGPNRTSRRASRHCGRTLQSRCVARPGAALLSRQGTPILAHDLVRHARRTVYIYTVADVRPPPPCDSSPQFAHAEPQSDEASRCDRARSDTARSQRWVVRSLPITSMLYAFFGATTGNEILSPSTYEDKRSIPRTTRLANPAGPAQPPSASSSPLEER